MVSQFPFGSDFVVLRDAMQQLLEDSVVPSRGARGSSRMATVARLPLDVFATNDAAIVIAAVPGLQPEGLDVTINQNTLSLAGSVPSAADSEQGKGATWYLQELGHGQFQRTVTLPFEVDATQAQAVFDNGLVRITLPKAARAKPQKIAVSRAESSRESIPVEATAN